MIEATIFLFIFLIFFCSARAKKGLKKGVSDSLETGIFLILKGNEACRDQITSNFEKEFDKLLKE